MKRLTTMPALLALSTRSGDERTFDAIRKNGGGVMLLDSGSGRLPRARSARGASTIEMALLLMCLTLGVGLGTRALGVRVCAAVRDATHAVSAQGNTEREASLEGSDPRRRQR